MVAPPKMRADGSSRMNTGGMMGVRTPVQPIVPESYPFFALPVKHLLELTEWRAHQDLLAEGKLINMTVDAAFADGSEVLFVSHQWTSFQHPDPTGVQLAALQRVVKLLMEGNTEVRTNSDLENHYAAKLITKGDEWKARLPGAVVWVE